MPKVIFYQQTGAQELERWMSQNFRDNDIVFEKDRYFPGGARITYEDCLSERDCYEIDSLAFKLSENWYRDSMGGDFSIYDGISLGKAVEYKLMKYFIRLVKDIFLLLRLKEKQNPQFFVFIDDNSSFSELLKGFSAAYGIRTLTIPVQSCHQRNYSKKGQAFRKDIKSVLWHFFALQAKFSRRESSARDTIIIEGYGKFTPLVKELARMGKRVIVLGRLGIEKGLFNPNISYRDWPDLFLFPEIQIDRDACRLIDKLGDNLTPGVLTQGCTFDRYNAGPIVIKQIQETITTDFRHIIKLLPRIKKFLIDCNAGTVITLQDRDGINRILASCANASGVKTVEIQHGTLSDVPHLTSPISDKICVWGAASKEFYLKRGVEEERISIVGLEEVKKAGTRHIRYLKKYLGLDCKKPVILFVSQPFIEITSLDSPLKTIELFDSLCEAAGNLSEINFLIKFHPNEDSTIKMERLRKTGYRNIFIAKKGVVSQLLSLSDALITFCSSIVLEASLLKIPVITVNLTGKKDFLPIAEMAGAIGVYNKKDLIPSIRSVLYDEQIRNRLIEGQKKFIESQVDSGKPSLERMLEVILRG